MNLQEINQIYDGFPSEGRDISREDFVKEMQRLTNQVGINRDLRRIMARKQTQSITAAKKKQEIDKAIENVR